MPENISDKTNNMLVKMPKDISDKISDRISNKISENIFKYMLNKMPKNILNIILNKLLIIKYINIIIYKIKNKF